ncbi:hypothetical protein EVAR_40545_1 [Eumeta japonica]|uniref:Uncharacterized protein n=1 Tax=Eumeta variegata TaxID=151549 RepID=A0A4C1XV65_EUMVA|nr:hypothetical protein EVAR_40545_1 [Eumeta japonica]
MFQALEEWEEVSADVREIVVKCDRKERIVLLGDFNDWVSVQLDGYERPLAAHGHSQAQRSQRWITDLLSRNMISNEREIRLVGGENVEGWMESGLRRGKWGDVEESGLPELSLIGRKATVKAVTSLLLERYPIVDRGQSHYLRCIRRSQEVLMAEEQASYLVPRRHNLYKPSALPPDEYSTKRVNAPVQHPPPPPAPAETLYSKFKAAKSVIAKFPCYQLGVTRDRSYKFGTFVGITISPAAQIDQKS